MTHRLPPVQHVEVTRGTNSNKNERENYSCASDADKRQNTNDKKEVKIRF